MKKNKPKVGRPQKFGEDTVTIAVRAPRSKRKALKKLIADAIAGYKEELNKEVKAFNSNSNVS